MNKNLNLVEILKNCPQGTKLYSIMHGEVEFEQIKYDVEYPIVFKYKGKDGIYYDDTTTIDGKFNINSVGECTLFPAKDQRDWSKFKVEPEMVDGEFYYCCYSHNKKENSFIFIYKKHLLYKTRCYAALNIFHSILFKDDLITNNNEIIIELRKATEDEKQLLLYAIERENYKWNNEKKELVKIESKFDINTLQPFDKVLIRDNIDKKWRCNFYSGYMEEHKYPFTCVFHVYAQCIPYNDETKHLVGTAEMPPKKYITWEE